MRNLLLFLIVIFLLFGCTKVDENGFYLEGEFKNLHKITKSEYDVAGYNIKGFDEKGFNSALLHNVTNTKYDENGFDYLGFDKNGYNANGFDEYGFNEEGYNNNGFDKNGYDKNGYNRKDFNKNGIHKVTKTKYDKNDYDCNGNKFVSAFDKRYFSDQFGDKTNTKYLRQEISGLFSNSATDYSNSYLTLIITKGNIVRFDIYEYNSGSKAHFSDYHVYRLYVKDESDKYHHFGMYPGSLKGMLSIREDDKFIKLLKKSYSLKILIREYNDETDWLRNDSPSATYDFIIDCTGFSRSLSFLTN